MILTNLRRQVVGLLNDSKLSIDGIYFVMRDIMHEIEMVYTEEMRKEQEQMFSQLAEEQKQEEKEEEQNSSSSND